MAIAFCENAINTYLLPEPEKDTAMVENDDANHPRADEGRSSLFKFFSLLFQSDEELMWQEEA
jgi:hypothetical protein